MSPINGIISGVRLDNSNVIALDELQRSYTVNLQPMNIQALNSFGMNTEHIDQYLLSSHTEYLINGSPMTVGPLRIGADSRNQYNTLTGRDEGPTLGAILPQYTIGMPSYYRNGNWSLGAQYTQLNVNPWLAFTGAWGKVNSSVTMDHVVTYYNDGFSSQTGLMHTSTNMTPGLVSKVSDIFGMWHESGFRWNDLGLYAGIKPVVLSGNVEARLPTGIDNNGNMLYTNSKLPLQSTVTPYARALYTGAVNKRTLYKLSAMSTFTGQYRLMSEMRFFFD
jgi:hypothetical protein